jgi:dextranase
MINSTYTLEVVPSKAQFRPGDALTFQLQFGGEHMVRDNTYSWYMYDEDQLIQQGEGFLTSGMGLTSKVLEVPAVANGSGAYGLFITLETTSGHIHAETAFDIAEHWREAPRYGFLSDFSPEEIGKLDDVEFLNKHHINLVQLYDWMYRHDRLLADTAEFIDPLGRSISHLVVSEKVEALREHGMASIAYAAVYGSLPDYAKQHPDQMLYQNDGKPHSLGEFFYIMDISTDSDWAQHIVHEFGQAIQVMGFDGLHLDQYGFPKKAIRQKDGKSEVVSLKELYPSFINMVSDTMKHQFDQHVGLIFNNVSNYPTHTTATASQDIMYIEVWDPVSRLRELKLVIDNARLWSGKQVVLAAYLPAFHPERPVDPAQAEIGATLTMAVIFASGGHHLLLGEHGNVLADPYYPHYGVMSEQLMRRTRHYYDYIVMYRNLLYDHELDDVSMTFAGGINTEIVLSSGDIPFKPNGEIGTVWTIVKEKPGIMIIHLINLLGVDNDLWHEAKAHKPEPVNDIEIRLECWETIDRIYWASPDGDSIKPESLEFDYIPKSSSGGLYVRCTVPRVDYWTMVCIKLKAGVPAERY